MPRNSLSARYRKLKVIYKISDFINSSTNSQTLLRRILREAMREMHATSGSIQLIDPQGEMLNVVFALGAGQLNTDHVQMRVGEGVTGRVAKTGRPLRVDDVSQSPCYIALREDVRSELAVPLRYERKTIGVLNVDSNCVGAFSEDDERLLAAVASQAARVIQTSRIYERLSQESRRLEALLEVSHALISADPLPDLLKRITRAVLSLMEVKQCSLLVLNERRELVLSAAASETGCYAQRVYPASTSVLGSDNAARQQPVPVFNVRPAPKSECGLKRKNIEATTLLSLPIYFQERLIGILNMYTDKPRRFESEELRLLNGFASLCGIGIENAQRYERALRAEEDIRQNDRLATLGILSAEIAREIRNPLTVISMLIHSLREDKAVPKSREHDLDMISQKLEHIENFVLRLMSFTKERGTPRPERIDINHLLDDLVFLVNHQLAARQILVRRRLDSSLPQILGDRGEFCQIFISIILNSIQAMPNGGVLTIKTQPGNAISSVTQQPAQKSGRSGRLLDSAVKQSISVTIRDTGAEIDPELLSQLFAPLTTARPPQREGMGLELFVAHRLLDRYGGAMSVKSSLEKGSSFTVQIPIDQPLGP
ncbi:MAG: GAF domain-containing protein [bacterium]